MIGAELGASFGMTSDYVGSLQQFSSDTPILVYVEGFEDVPFWKRILKDKVGLVDVVAYGQKNKANGKGTLTSAIRNHDVELGKHLIVALDSDYDYLLDINVDIFERDTVLQTYAYSLENIRWSPEHVDHVCQTASNNTTYLPDDKLKNGILNWSATVYPLFLRYLKGGSSDGELFSSILTSFQLDEGTICYKGEAVEDFLDNDFIKKMQDKGLVANSTYLFIRGHDYANKLNAHCQEVNGWVFNKMKDDLEQHHGDNAGQFIGELKNHQCEPAAVIKGVSISCGLCIPKIKSDIDDFMSVYH